MPDAVGRLLEEMCQDPVCLIHTDVRLDNVFFGDGEIMLVDWQAVCTSAPEQDVAYFVTQSVAPEVRAQDDLVKFYHGELVSHGIATHTEEDTCFACHGTEIKVEGTRVIEWEDGETYPLIKVEISSASHPFFTGKQKLVDTAGRIDKFRRRYGMKGKKAEEGAEEAEG